MNFEEDDVIICDNYTGPCRGRLNYSILTGWVPYEPVPVPGTEFEMPSDYFRHFEENSEFILFDVADLTSIYKFRLVGFNNGVAILKIIDVYPEDGKIWLYEYEIKFGTDFGIIEFIGVYKNPGLKLIKS